MTDPTYEPIPTLCPACAKPAIYHHELDRYFHSDGTDNHPCWLAILRGHA